MINLSAAALLILALLFFITSVVGVVTGSNSLVTVPVMFQFGIEPKTAVATNMFGLTFMSIGASIPFLRQNLIDKKRLPRIVSVTILGSTLGALLVGWLKSEWMPVIVSISMVAVTLFTFVKSDAGVNKETAVSSKSLVIAYVLTFLLAIYGGLFSGGYVTMLTAAFVAFFGMTFTEAIAETKVINVFSSAVATIIFMWQGLVDYRLGAILAVVMFVGAYVGAHTVTKLNDLWLKRIFLATVLILALKILIFDVLNL